MTTPFNPKGIPDEINKIFGSFHKETDLEKIARLAEQIKRIGNKETKR